MAKMTLDELVAQLTKAFGENLRAVVLYGSAVNGEHARKSAGQDVLVIVRALGAEQLRAASAAARSWAESGNPAPLTLTEAEWRRSADIFPMEYADILERHRVLHGTPPFEGIRVEPEHLRRELEEQAMGKLLHLRQGALASGGDGRLQLELLEVSLGDFMAIFRAIVRLRGGSPPADNEALTREIASSAGFDPEPVLRVVRHARGSARLTPALAGETLAGYLTAVDALVSWLDRLDAGRPGGPGFRTP
jgi:hypothetical protein